MRRRTVAADGDAAVIERVANFMRRGPDQNPTHAVR
jgi:hypothetical protein